MTRPLSILAALGITSFVFAQAPQVTISIGVRETGASGQMFTFIGDDGGTTGGIEWIDLDGQTLTLDGTWQQFTFDFSTASVTTFAGSTANGVLEGQWGTLEHIRILNAQGITDPINIWIDDLAQTVTPPGGNPTTTVFGDFQDPAYMQGDEVMFQEPSFSGSTATNVNAGSVSGVDLTVVPSNAMKASWQFVDNQPTRWVRLTTFNVINQPNPLIRFDQNAVLTFWMRGGECQPDLGFQGPGTAYSEMCGSGLNAGERSVYGVAGAPANAPGGLFISLDGGSNFPFLGGTLVSFGGFLFSASVMADQNGVFTLQRVPGDAAVVDLVWQSLWLDLTQGTIQFTNAIRAEYGR